MAAAAEKARKIKRQKQKNNEKFYAKFDNGANLAPLFFIFKFNRNKTIYFLYVKDIGAGWPINYSTIQNTCGRGDSNPHGYSPLDPEPSASTSSATSALKLRIYPITCHCQEHFG